MLSRTPWLFIAFAFMAAVILSGCGKQEEPGFDSGWSVQAISEEDIPPVAPVVSGDHEGTSVVADELIDQESFLRTGRAGGRVRHPLHWERHRGDAFQWSNWTYQVIRAKGRALLAGSRDVGSFCPRYYGLSQHQKENFWALLISAMSRFESNHNPLDRYHETSMGADRLTGQPTYSEGLLQLSYQDNLTYPAFCRFNWRADSRLSPRDPRRSILNPYQNLECGIQILNQQVARYGLIARPGGYWSILRPESRYTKLSQIRAITMAMPGCR